MDQYAVIGNPVAHSHSPFVHQQFAKQTGQQLEYIRLLAPLDQFETTVVAFQHQGGKGANVTVPFKEQAYALATLHSPQAQQAKAVNTLKFAADGSIFGDNTDGTGLIRDLVNNHGCSITGQNILILGAGGATRGIVGPLLDLTPKQLIIANRTADKALQLAQHFAPFSTENTTLIQGIGLDELTPQPYDLIINATSAGLTSPMFELPSGLITEPTFCYDLVYGKSSQTLTPFLSWAQQQGATHLADGLGMLVEQAAAAFYLWRGVYPETLPVMTALKQRLAMTTVD